MSFYNPGDVVVVNFPYRDNPTRFKPRPGLIISIEDENYYRVCQITTTNRHSAQRGDWILASSQLGQALGINKDSFLNIDNILILHKSSILGGPIGEHPDFEDLVDRFGL